MFKKIKNRLIKFWCKNIKNGKDKNETRGKKCNPKNENKKYFYKKVKKNN